MYAVFFGAGSYDDAHEELLFVTADQELASSFCSKAQAEYDEAFKIPLTWESGNVKDYLDKRFEYKEKLEKIIITHPEKATDYGLESDARYWYCEVEVR